jgi:hypothetical protein
MPLLQISWMPQHAPLLHCRLVPHAVPLATFVPVSVQTGVPPLQESVPVWHGLGGVQAEPEVHVVQMPALQTRLVPQVVPFGAFEPVSVHTGTPVEQLIVPAWHALPLGVQEAPWVHATHEPLSQTMFVPHDAPLARLDVWSAHVDAPVEHDVRPLWHGLLGVHAVPAVQLTHDPPEQTWLVPHAVPLVAFVPVSVQVEMPVAQEVAPAWHGFVEGVHAWPEMQDTHELPPSAPPSAEFRQTRLVPQLVPFGWGPVSLQTDVPVSHDVVPVSQVSAGVHETPAVHATQLPALQTLFVPQTAPLAAVVPVSVHVADVQLNVPVWQGFAEGVHGLPSVQLLQAPLWQIWPVPHPVPSGRLLAVTEQVAVPVEQSME